MLAAAVKVVFTLFSTVAPIFGMELPASREAIIT